MERMKSVAETVGRAVWSHRGVYVCLACTYGAACLGVDKEVINQAAAAFYAMLAAQRH